MTSQYKTKIEKLKDMDHPYHDAQRWLADGSEDVFWFDSRYDLLQAARYFGISVLNNETPKRICYKIKTELQRRHDQKEDYVQGLSYLRAWTYDSLKEVLIKPRKLREYKCATNSQGFTNHYQSPSLRNILHDQTTRNHIKIPFENNTMYGTGMLEWHYTPDKLKEYSGVEWFKILTPLLPQRGEGRHHGIPGIGISLYRFFLDFDEVSEKEFFDSRTIKNKNQFVLFHLKKYFPRDLLSLIGGYLYFLPLPEIHITTTSDRYLVSDTRTSVILSKGDWADIPERDFEHLRFHVGDPLEDVKGNLDEILFKIPPEKSVETIISVPLFGSNSKVTRQTHFTFALHDSCGIIRYRTLLEELNKIFSMPILGNDMFLHLIDSKGWSWHPALTFNNPKFGDLMPHRLRWITSNKRWRPLSERNSLEVLIEYE